MDKTVKNIALALIGLFLAYQMEAYAHGGNLAGVFTVVGFATSVYVILMERALAG